VGFVVCGRIVKMATEVYNKDNILLVDGTEIEIIPLKIKYLREFMKTFDQIRVTKTDDEAIEILAKCVQVCMKQYYPKISKSLEEIEDNVDLPTIYKIVDVAAGIKINKKSEEPVKNQAVDSGSTWDNLDLAKLESEAFLLGIWKDYQELEESLSMPELLATLMIKRELDHTEKKFLAALQGVNLDDQGSDGKVRGQKEWDDLKARVFSKGQTKDSNDVLSLQGPTAKKSGFGIGMGLDYEDLRK
jgi:hypothetical protein